MVVGTALYTNDWTASTSGIQYIKNSSGSTSIAIENGGDVGIGTAAPAEKLTVAGNISAQGDVCIGDDLIVNGESITVCGAAAMLNLCDTTDSDDMYITYANAGTAYACVGYLSTSDFDICTNNRDISLLPGTHNVGIGETNPRDAKLTVAGTISAQSGLSASGDVHIGNDGNIIFDTGATVDKIQSDASFLVLEGGNITLRKCGGSEDFAKFVSDGPACLYYNNLIKFQTANTGIDVTGGLSATGANNYFANNVGIGTNGPSKGLEICSGTGDDGIILCSTGSGGRKVAELQIDNVSNGNADFRLYCATNITTRITTNAANPTYFNAGNVGIGTTTPTEKLHVDGSACVKTLSAIYGDNNYFAGCIGIGTTAPAEKLTVAGNISATGSLSAACGISVPDQAAITLGNDHDFTICHQGSQSYITDQGTGGLYLRTNGPAIYLTDTDGNTMGQFTDNGSSFLYYNHSLKFKTTNTGACVYGGATVAGDVSASGNGYFACVIAGGYFEEKAAHPTLAEYPTGSLVVISSAGNLELSTKSNDKNIFGVTQNGVCQPIVLGAEPVLVTGNINVGDFITTSDKAGHGKRTLNTIHGSIIAQAMEAGSGCSYTLQAMIRKM